MVTHALRAWALQLMSALALALVLKDNSDEEIGHMNANGVTKYQTQPIRAVKKREGHWWPDSTARNNEEFAGVQDLTSSISWGWHHPNGVWDTIPIGGPMIDGSMNVYVAADDGLRKFSAIGDLIWSAAMRGQMAAAPSLLAAVSSSLRTIEPEVEAASQEEEDALEAEQELRPDWAASKLMGKVQMIDGEVKVGDRLKVRKGMGYHAEGVEYFKAGDKGKVTRIAKENGEERVYIVWPRTGFESVAGLANLATRFVRLKKRGQLLPEMLVGSTTGGFVFAVAPETGGELWATKISEQIAGVKGSVNGWKGIIVLATDLCKNKYCYRYRSAVQPLVQGNTVIKGVDASDGSPIWSFTPHTPVWNFVPYFDEVDGRDVVLFSDFSGGAYCVNLRTGIEIWKSVGNYGTWMQGSGFYAKNTPIQTFYALGHQSYDIGVNCNPHPPPGMLLTCAAGPETGGYMKSINASSGLTDWTLALPLPPIGGSHGHPTFQQTHFRLIITMGFPCTFRAESRMWVVDPAGDRRLEMEGPRFWADSCPGEKSAADIRKLHGGRITCEPASWSWPVVDSHGDIYVGNQLGNLQKWSSPTGRAHDVKIMSSLETGQSFQEQGIAFAPGMMAATTCTSLIVFQTYNSSDAFGQDNWTFYPSNY